MSIHCEEVGGTGSAFLKGCNNEDLIHNCYTFVINYNKSILKASRELPTPFLSQLDKLYRKNSEFKIKNTS